MKLMITTFLFGMTISAMDHPMLAPLVGRQTLMIEDNGRDLFGKFYCFHKYERDAFSRVVEHAVCDITGCAYALSYTNYQTADLTKKWVLKNKWIGSCSSGNCTDCGSGHPDIENQFYWLLADDSNEELIKDKLPIINLNDEWFGIKHTYLRQAIRFGSIKNLALLLQHPKMLEFLPRSQALLDSMVMNQLQMAEMLLAHGANPQKRYPDDTFSLVDIVKRCWHLPYYTRNQMIGLLQEYGAPGPKFHFEPGYGLYHLYCWATGKSTSYFNIKRELFNLGRDRNYLFSLLPKELLIELVQFINEKKMTQDDLQLLMKKRGRDKS